MTQRSAALPRTSAASGKVLRADLLTGEPLADNPFVSAADPRQRCTGYGHRNVQEGVAVRPAGGRVPGGVFLRRATGQQRRGEPHPCRRQLRLGPVAGAAPWAGTTESVPMTDRRRFPDAVPAVWRSGSTTQAICAAAFLAGSSGATWRVRWSSPRSRGPS
ncbi:MAG: PQQ-dependent sugar dehydrogenase [Nocardioides sp.]